MRLSLPAVVRAPGVAALLGFAAAAPFAAVAAPPAAPAASQADSVAIPAPVGFVNDDAGLMQEADRARLEAFLDQLKHKTGAEFAVLTVRSTGPVPPEQYKVQVFQRWGLGQKGVDNGLLMLVVVDDHVVRFETGYGLEGTLPDGLQSRIFRSEMRPRFREGDYTGGIVAGVLACSAKIAEEKGVKLEWNGRELRYRRHRDPPPLAIAFIVFVVIMMIMLAASSGGGRRRRRGGYWGGPWYGGWGGGFGGGWGGGGGGGASFGGFGGGASGGGGGGGSW